MTRVVDACLLIGLAACGAGLYGLRHVAVASDDVQLRSGEPFTAEYRVREVRRSDQGSVHVIADAVSLRHSPRATETCPESACATRAHAAPSPADQELPSLSGAIWTRWPADSGPPDRGDAVVLTGEIRVPQGRRNPGAFDFSLYLRNRCVGAVLDISDVRVERRGRGLADAAGWVERVLRSSVPGDAGKLLTALLLGQGAMLSEELRSAFRRSGTVHILAVSGLHVGFVLLIAHALLRSLRVPPRVARLACLPALACFAILVGPKASVVRAAVMASALIIASTLQRKTHPLNSLGVAGLVLLLARPGSLFDLGFQLSFSAVGGILLMFPTISTPLRRRLSPLGAAGSHVADALALSLSAQAGVAPILAGTFGEFSVVAPLANLAAVPLAGAAVACGISLVAMQPIGGLPARAMSAAAWACSRGLISVTGPLGRATWATLRVDSRFWPAVLCAVTASVVFCGTRRRTGKRAAFVLLALAAGMAATLATTGPARSYPRIVFFDVGQGDSVLLELPRRRYVLVDAGPGPIVRRTEDGAQAGFQPWDAGADVVVPYLGRAGVGSLEAVVITHAHADHLGGALSVIENVPTKLLVLAGGRARDAPFAAVVRAVRGGGGRVVEVSAGDTLKVGRFRLAVLAPIGYPKLDRVTENNASVVIGTELHGASVLLTGDIESPVEADLLTAGSLRRADVLKVAHHGSSSSTGASFLERVRPRAAVIQVGPENRYGHPDAGTLARLREAGATVVRTDLDGAVLATFGRGRFRLSCVASGGTCDYIVEDATALRALTE
ncbi:MAG: DNA internalization-related competence protein ComEC/Rec2 [Candidatus Eisenbacteria bacterium]|nr:DNA internalization-related competence protein ComEC/Rec2 [Candidatus Eisenbacteria bacterium]